MPKAKLKQNRLKLEFGFFNKAVDTIFGGVMAELLPQFKAIGCEKQVFIGGQPCEMLSVGVDILKALDDGG